MASPLKKFIISAAITCLMNLMANDYIINDLSALAATMVATSAFGAFTIRPFITLKKVFVVVAVNGGATVLGAWWFFKSVGSDHEASLPPATYWTYGLVMAAVAIVQLSYRRYMVLAWCQQLLRDSVAPPAILTNAAITSWKKKAGKMLLFSCSTILINGLVKTKFITNVTTLGASLFGVSALVGFYTTTHYFHYRRLGKLGSIWYSVVFGMVMILNGSMCCVACFWIVKSFTTLHRITFSMTCAYVLYMGLAAVLYLFYYSSRIKPILTCVMTGKELPRYIIRPPRGDGLPHEFTSIV